VPRAPLGQVGHLGVRIGRDLIFLAKMAYFPQFLRNGVFEQFAALRHDVAELVANLLVHDAVPAYALSPLAASIP